MAVFLLKVIKKLSMNWYISKIIFHIKPYQEDSKSREFDEQIRLIQAEDLHEAYFKASAIGKEEESNFSDQNIKWQFIAIADLKQLQNLENGAKIFTSSKETNSYVSYIHYVKQKEKFILSKAQNNILQAVS